MGLEGQTLFGLPPHTSVSFSPTPSAGVWGLTLAAWRKHQGNVYVALSLLAFGSWQAEKALPGSTRRALPLGGSGDWPARLGALASPLCLLSPGQWFWTAGRGCAGCLVPPPVPQLLKSGGEGVK